MGGKTPQIKLQLLLNRLGIETVPIQQWIGEQVQKYPHLKGDAPSAYEWYQKKGITFAPRAAGWVPFTTVFGIDPEEALNGLQMWDKYKSIPIIGQFAKHKVSNLFSESTRQLLNYAYNNEPYQDKLLQSFKKEGYNPSQEEWKNITNHVDELRGFYSLSYGNPVKEFMNSVKPWVSDPTKFSQLKSIFFEETK